MKKFSYKPELSLTEFLGTSFVFDKMKFIYEILPRIKDYAAIHENHLSKSLSSSRGKESLSSSRGKENLSSSRGKESSLPPSYPEKSVKNYECLTYPVGEQADQISKDERALRERQQNQERSALAQQKKLRSSRRSCERVQSYALEPIDEKENEGKSFASIDVKGVDNKNDLALSDLMTNDISKIDFVPEKSVGFENSINEMCNPLNYPRDGKESENKQTKELLNMILSLNNVIIFFSLSEVIITAFF